MERLFPLFYFLGLPLLVSITSLFVLNLIVCKDDSVRGFKDVIKKTSVQGIGALAFAITIFILHFEAFWPR